MHDRKELTAELAKVFYSVGETSAVHPNRSSNRHTEAVSDHKAELSA